MCFYGIIGGALSILELMTLALNVGEGYNEFNLEKGTIEIFRFGFYGKNREIKIEIKIKDVL